jgi:thiol-disulfide isomerase/thioredoxin
MRPLGVVLLVCCVLAVPFATAEASALRIEPACPVTGVKDSETKEIHVTYNPQDSAATIKNPHQLELEVGINGQFHPNNTRSVPFTRQDNGSWQATLIRGEKDSWLYLIFQVKDGAAGQIDDNLRNYWDVALCLPDGRRHFQGVEEQARSYTGYRFDNGIQRTRDYTRALAILDDFIKSAGGDDRYSLLFDYWDYKVRSDGGDDEAWQKVSAEIAKFIDDQRLDLFALSASFGFVMNHPKELSPDLYPKLLVAIDQLDPERAQTLDRMGMFNAIRREKDNRKRADALASFVQKYPHDHDAPWAAAERLRALRELHDVDAAESWFPQVVQFDPARADTYATMAAIYVENQRKPDQALKLLDQAEQLGIPGREVSGPQIPFYTIVTTDPEYSKTALAYWRARAYLQVGKENLALSLAQEVINRRKGSDDYFLLAQAYEAAGEKQKAVDAYLEAVEHSSGDELQKRERLEHLWIDGGLGTKEQLDEKIRAQQNDAFRKANYVPQLVDSPASDYEFTTLTGEKVRSADLRSKIVVLNFWGTWCSPCLPELPGFQELQRKHPELIVAALAISSERESLDQLIQKEKLNGLRIAQADSLKDAFVPAGVPITYVIQNGRIRVIHNKALSNVVAYIEADLSAMQEEKPRTN